jgi:hypothetical protein
MNLKRYLSLILAVIFCASACVFAASCNNSEEEDGQGQSVANPFYIVYRDVKIELDKKADDVLAKLGKAKSEDNLGDCGGIGVQMKYTYTDITINTLKEENGEYIHKILFITDLAQTNRGISIGSDEADVRSEYGTPSSEENGKLIYKMSDLELEFTIKDGAVSAVNYRRIR